MATISDLGIPSAAGKGILQPLLANKFRVMYRSWGFATEQCHELTVQTVSVGIDFKNKQLRLRIEQPISGDVLEVLESLVQHPIQINVQAMDGGDGVVSSMEFTKLKTASHDFKLDYAAPSQAATHEVVMDYEHLLIKSIFQEK